MKGFKSISSIKSEFRNQAITKAEFMDRMHELYMVLFDFSENLEGTEIEKIGMENGKVIFITRKTEFNPGGVKFYVDRTDRHIPPYTAFSFDSYEKGDAVMLYKLIGEKDTIFDIGANIGWYSNHLAKEFPQSAIYSFEPIPGNFNMLSANTALNESANIHLNNFAFSDSIRTLEFYYSPVIGGASSSVNITENDSMVKVECQTNTIDQFVIEHKIERLDFIKCDVEGAEFMVYKGGAATIEKFKPIVFSEMLRKWSAKFNYHPNDIIDFFRQFGYNCYVVSGGKLKEFDLVTEDTIETNYFFLHPEKHAAKIAELS